MPSQTAENVNSPAASSTFFNGIVDSLAAIIGSMSVAFACGRNAGMRLRVSALQLSSTARVMPLPGKRRPTLADFIAQGLCFYRSKNIIFSPPIGAESFGIPLKLLMILRRNNR
ncbi:hypothetical protein JK621_21525 [Serratia plymuthica]|uniref:hypothetical protein n=1 Tax=Serratia plymuthica TaxID=82996 RepID=UPI001BAE7F80|nr:hypothetical protein [Serratia plymuthica]QUY47935.1 hypothetical protein JK621_21525 [Serratia plymuthica]